MIPTGVWLLVACGIGLLGYIIGKEEYSMANQQDVLSIADRIVDTLEIFLEDKVRHPEKYEKGRTHDESLLVLLEELLRTYRKLRKYDRNR